MFAGRQARLMFSLAQRQRLWITFVAHPRSLVGVWGKPHLIHASFGRRAVYDNEER
jgi:hypothetical protein